MTTASFRPPSPTPRPDRSARLRSRAVAVSLALASPLVPACHRPAPPAAAAPAARDVEVVQIAPRDLPVDFEFVGRTASSQRVEIRARVAGFLEEIAYAEGEPVAPGDLLFRLDPKPFEARLQAARAELAQQQARLDNAQALLARVRPLAAENAVAQKELDDAEGRVSEASAAVEAAGARVFSAELDLSYTRITAPAEGLGGEATQREGAYISSTTPPLTTVSRIDPIWVEFSVSETQALRALRAESAGTVQPPADANFQVGIVLADGTEHPYAGRVTFADATINPQTGTFRIRAELPNPDRTLRPGQFVRVILRGAIRPAAILVPQRAVQEGRRGAFVWVVDRDGRAEQRPVEPGPWHGEGWVIENGLEDGDRVVTTGTVGLRPGTPLSIVKIARDAAAATTAGSSASPAPADRGR
jgi:membrane fusion protein (multidrug efflux system)